MTHLEGLIAEYLSWQGFLVRTNWKVGKRVAGGYEGELDVVGYSPKLDKVLHYEPSIDAEPWHKREARYKKKFDTAEKYILTEVLDWLPPTTSIEHIAVFVTHPKNRPAIAGFRLMSIDELVAEIRTKVIACGIVASAAIPEQYPSLRTLQLSHAGYYRSNG